MSSPVFDFAAKFTTIDSQEAGAEFEVKSDDGKPSGFFITLAGPDSKRRKPFIAKAQRVMANAVDDTGKIKEEGAEQADADWQGVKLDEMVAATVSWRFANGVEGPKCDAENVRSLYAQYPSIYRQVLVKSGDLGRFTKR